MESAKRSLSLSNVICILLIIIIILVSVIIIAWLNFRDLQSQPIFSQIFSLEDKKNFVIFIFGILASLVIAFFPFFRKLKDKKHPPKSLDNQPPIELQDKESSIELLESLNKDISFFDGRECRNFQVRAKLTVHKKNNKFFLCTVTYSYTKTIRDNSGVLKFRIKRMWKNEHFNNKKNIDDYFCYERYFEFDEKIFHKELESWKPEEMYHITNLFVSSKSSAKPVKLAISRKLEGDPFNTSFFDFEAKLPDWAQGEITLKYEVQHIIEKTGFVFFNIEIPTKSFDINFDYGTVKRQLSCINCLDFLSSHDTPVIMDTSSVRGEGEIHRVWNGWLIPKSSSVIIWSEKK